MSTLAFARHVLREGSKADEQTKRQARLFLTLRKLKKNARTRLRQRATPRQESRVVEFGASLESRREPMNTLILNRDFKLAEDGWYQISPVGEFAHSHSGVVQVVDRAACEAMAAAFRNDAGIEPADAARAEGFPGVLVDFDHFSLDSGQRSEAAGWLTNLECRDTGLWGEIRWSDAGEEAVKGGRYRFISPVWAKSDCQDLGDGRVRPVRLLNAAVTNDPNLKGMVPLSNSRLRSEASPGQGREDSGLAGWDLDARSAVDLVAEEKAGLRNRRECDGVETRSAAEIVAVEKRRVRAAQGSDPSSPEATT